MPCPFLKSFVYSLLGQVKDKRTICPSGVQESIGQVKVIYKYRSFSFVVRNTPGTATTATWRWIPFMNTLHSSFSGSYQYFSQNNKQSGPPRPTKVIHNLEFFFHSYKRDIYSGLKKKMPTSVWHAVPARIIAWKFWVPSLWYWPQC